MSLVDPGRPEAPSVAVTAASRTTIVVSLAAHALVLLAVVVVPLFAQVRLPPPSQPIAAYIRAAVYHDVPDLAPRRATAMEPAGPPATPAAAPPATAAAPVSAPTTIGDGEPPSPFMPGGVEGGVPWSAVGAVGIGLPGPPAREAPPSPPPAVRVVRVGGDVRAPQKLRHVAPVYPQIAAQARITGTVILEATISPEGAVVDVRVLRSVPLLDAAAVDAVRQWRYDPPLLNGTPVAVLLTVTIRFAP
jgi:periplasmic protein TonB